MCHNLGVDWTTFQLCLPIKFLSITFHLLLAHRKMEET